MGKYLDELIAEKVENAPPMVMQERETVNALLARRKVVNFRTKLMTLYRIDSCAAALRCSRAALVDELCDAGARDLVEQLSERGLLPNVMNMEDITAYAKKHLVVGDTEPDGELEFRLLAVRAVEAGESEEGEGQDD